MSSRENIGAIARVRNIGKEVEIDYGEVIRSGICCRADRRTDDAQTNDAVDYGPDVVQKLKNELREKDMVLTDIRLEALSSADQLESLKDTVVKMRVSFSIHFYSRLWKISRKFCGKKSVFGS